MQRKTIRLAGLLSTVLATVGVLARPIAADQTAAAPAYVNRLIHSADPYLLEHAHNPVDWFPWGPEAFAKAKAENKPIFLSIGYSTCYWCHVAEREIYADPAIAALMNKWFVNVKVDREERPDVDRLFIVATEMLTQHGAWPNNLFLTPDGRPFYAGSYFPPKDDGGQPGFPRVLSAIHDLWGNHRAEKVEPAASEVMAALRQYEEKSAATSRAPVEPRAWLKAAARTLLGSVDPVNGGFGRPTGGPKFPQAPALALLAADARLDGDAAAGTAVVETLQAMALGGIRDQLAGGFGRYATEPTWTIPHFEMMLSDNAQLLSLYVDAYRRTNDPLDLEIARNTAAYLLNDMTLPDGGFATAQDAATNGVEGATYLWTRAGIEAVLGADDTERFLAAYEVAAVPEAAAQRVGMTGTPGVLRVRLPLADALRRTGASEAAGLLAAFAPMRAKLLAARDTRPQPMRDDKLVVGLNGLAIAALARAGAGLAAPELTAAAARAADRITALAFDPANRVLKHQIFAGQAAGEGFLDDYAAFGDGLLALAEATGDVRWRTRASAVADALLHRFLQANGALAAGVSGDALLPVALEDNQDADVPSGTSTALDLLSRLGSDPGGGRFADAAARVAAHLAGHISAHPTMWPSAVVALAERPPQIAVALASSTVSATAASGSARLGVPSTADHVRASAAVLPGAGGDTVRVTLTVDPGFHINAHVPSLGYLVPTDLAFTGAAPAAVEYPKSVSFRPGFGKEPLEVYDGTVAIVATLPRATASWTATVTAQACDARTCLPPATIAAPVARAER